MAGMISERRIIKYAIIGLCGAGAVAFGVLALWCFYLCMTHSVELGGESKIYFTLALVLMIPAYLCLKTMLALLGKFNQCE